MKYKLLPVYKSTKEAVKYGWKRVLTASGFVYKRLHSFDLSIRFIIGLFGTRDSTLNYFN